MFRDFANLETFAPKNLPGQDLKYTLIPEGKNRWTIFLSDNSRVRVGSLALSDSSNMSIELFDSNSGSVQERLFFSAM